MTARRPVGIAKVSPGNKGRPQGPNLRVRVKDQMAADKIFVIEDSKKIPSRFGMLKTHGGGGPPSKRSSGATCRARKYPSEEWARIRVYGEAFNAALRWHVVKRLEEAGHSSVAPVLVPNWTYVISKRFSYASSWSERHVAHAAGLGTFCLRDGLITARGKALRIGSVVARKTLERGELPPPPPIPLA